MTQAIGVIATRIVTRTVLDVAPTIFGKCTGRLWSPVAQDSFIWVSEDGEVVSLHKKVARRLKPTMSGAYHAVNVGQRQTTTYVHKLIAETFLGPRPFSSAQVRHLDGDRFNNALGNLAWGTPTENSADKVLHGTDNAGERNSMAKLTRSKVAEMRQLRNAEGISFKEIAKRFGVSTMTAHRAITGVSWK